MSDVGGSFDPQMAAAQSYPNTLAPLAVIPEHGTIDVASTPSIPEEEPFDPPSASSSFRLTRSPAGVGAEGGKDWSSIETRLEVFARNLNVSPWGSFKSDTDCSDDAPAGLQTEEALLDVTRRV